MCKWERGWVGTRVQRYCTCQASACGSPPDGTQCVKAWVLDLDTARSDCGELDVTYTMKGIIVAVYICILFCSSYLELYHLPQWSPMGLFWKYIFCLHLVWTQGCTVWDHGSGSLPMRCQVMLGLARCTCCFGTYGCLQCQQTPWNNLSFETPQNAWTSLNVFPVKCRNNSCMSRWTGSRESQMGLEILV